VVGAGETLRSIARRYFGAESHWPRVWLANATELEKPDAGLTKGVLLRIPPLTEMSAAERRILFGAERRSD
jgi:hypothetical protein